MYVFFLHEENEEKNCDDYWQRECGQIRFFFFLSSDEEVVVSSLILSPFRFRDENMTYIYDILLCSLKNHRCMMELEKCYDSYECVAEDKQGTLDKGYFYLNIQESS